MSRDRFRSSRCLAYGGRRIRPPRAHDCFADEIAIDFPSVGHLVERVRDGFLGEGGDVATTLTTEVSLSRRDASSATVVPLEVPLRGTCAACGGRGETWTEPCAACRGTGDVARAPSRPPLGAGRRRRRRPVPLPRQFSACRTDARRGARRRRRGVRQPPARASEPVDQAPRTPTAVLRRIARPRGCPRSAAGDAGGGFAAAPEEPSRAITASA